MQNSAAESYNADEVFCMLKRAISNILSLCDEARYIFMGTLKLSCAMLAMGLVLAVLYDCGFDRQVYMLARSYYELPQGFILVGTVLSVLVEERCHKG